MKPGGVIVDVAVEQGGCVETARPTTHADPTFVIDGLLHVCVANVPGAVRRTSTFDLTNATLTHAIGLGRSDRSKRSSAANCVAAHLTREADGEVFAVESITAEDSPTPIS